MPDSVSCKQWAFNRYFSNEWLSEIVRAEQYPRDVNWKGRAESTVFRSPYLHERGQRKRELVSILRLNMNSEGTPKPGENGCFWERELSPAYERETHFSLYACVCLPRACSIHSSKEKKTTQKVKESISFKNLQVSISFISWKNSDFGEQQGAAPFLRDKGSRMVPFAFSLGCLVYFRYLLFIMRKK